jgi:hypothetical protein
MGVGKVGAGPVNYILILNIQILRILGVRRGVCDIWQGISGFGCLISGSITNVGSHVRAAVRRCILGVQTCISARSACSTAASPRASVAPRTAGAACLGGIHDSAKVDPCVNLEHGAGINRSGVLAIRA